MPDRGSVDDWEKKKRVESPRGARAVHGYIDREKENATVLSEALAKAVAGRRKVATGELRCQGTRKVGSREVVPCQALLRYKLNLNYD